MPLIHDKLLYPAFALSMVYKNVKSIKIKDNLITNIDVSHEFLRNKTVPSNYINKGLSCVCNRYKNLYLQRFRTWSVTEIYLGDGQMLRLTYPVLCFVRFEKFGQVFDVPGV